MKEVCINERKNVYCRFYFSKQDQQDNGSLCYFNVLENEVLAEIVEKQSNRGSLFKNKRLLGFRIYKNTTVDLNDLTQMLLEDGKYFNEKIDSKYDYVAN